MIRFHKQIWYLRVLPLGIPLHFKYTQLAIDLFNVVDFLLMVRPPKVGMYHLKKRLDTDATREAYDILKTVDASDAPAQIVKKIKEVIGKLQEL